ncbi:hypothetical protein AAC387_Pa10g0368 [Persea americana]
MFLRRVTVRLSPLRKFFSSNSSIDVAVAELNKEMELIFGEPPSSSHGSIESSPTVQESQYTSPESGECGLTHVDSSGEARMVDISAKKSSNRVAIAGCRVILGEKVFNLVVANKIAKGDVLNIAKIAGITGAKQTSSLIPLCHNIGLTNVRVDLKLNNKDFSIEIEGEAASTGKTGVEMEAMTAVTIAGLTVYDMCKAASKDIQITDVRLEHKRGGKSGVWSRKQ